MKSYVSDLLSLADCIVRDASAKCAGITLDERDLKTIRSRVEHEGLSFLTMTLPSLGQDLERALDQGWVASTHFRSFRKRGKIPAFLQGFFRLVFDEEGRILNDPDTLAVEGIRQIAYTFKKLEVACSPLRVYKALQGYQDVEHETFSVPLDPGDIEKYLDLCQYLWANVFHDDIDFMDDLRPRHGPGATADKLSGNRKFYLREWHQRLEPYFPLLDTVFANAEARSSEEFKVISLVDEEQERPVRVITVPKTLKAPRIIAIEPTCMQYTQQALSNFLYKKLESSWITGGHINFKDQSVNQKLALSSSATRKYCTIDLSSASDRVPLSLALHMFDSNPDLRDAINACRSKKAQMPDGTVLSLKKFASMGSALCFPIEAMYFYTLCVLALIEERNLPLTLSSIRLVKDDVFVYGDDILVPTNESAAVVRTLQKYYCKVNTSKSFWLGNFRESCGMDAFMGVEVTPTYVRKVPPNNRRSCAELVSWVATSNLFYRKGYWCTSSYMVKQCERYLGKLPIVSPRSSALGKVSFQSCVSADRWNIRYQAPEIRAWVASPVYSRDVIEGEPALTKCLLKLEDHVIGQQVDGKHLERTARHGAVTLKRRWVSPY